VEQNNESFVGRLQLYVQPDTKLLLAANAIATDSKGNIVGETETTYSYPETGPTDIYDLGVPDNATIVSNLPEEDYQAIWDNYRLSRINATREYIAVVTHTSLLDFTNMVDIDYKSGRKHRLERHSVFNEGEDIDKCWPIHKKQLGDSFNSLMAWSNAHYDTTGYISVYLYDGEYNISTKRDSQGTWSKLGKSYSPNSEFMPNIRLEDIGWPLIGKTGHIIENKYAKENNFICIERLQQGSIYSGNVSLPGKFLFYLDSQRNYICRRKVTEWRPDAEWQKDKSWLDGIEPEKIRDRSITVTDITEVTQGANGYWYPKTIEVKQTGIRTDYKEAKLKTTATKKLYIETQPEFPEGLFDLDNLPKEFE